MTRRSFLTRVGTLAASASVLPELNLSAASLMPATPQRLPRWRGFNLTEKFTKHPEGNPTFKEDDFSLLADWGFDFVRLPMSYLCWSDASDWLKLRERELKDIDEVVKFGARHGVHVNLNLHRAPGYCVNPPKEPLDLWS